jgi:hypothetical protein
MRKLATAFEMQGWNGTSRIVRGIWFPERMGATIIS